MRAALTKSSQTAGKMKAPNTKGDSAMKRTVTMTLLSVLLAICLVFLSACRAKTTDNAGTDTAGETTSDATRDAGTGTTDFAAVTEATLAVDAETLAAAITGDFSITTEDGEYEQSGSVYTVTAAGEYTLTGVLSEGQIVVDAGDDDKVTLVLDAVTVTCSTDSPILIKNADKVKIKAADCSYNVVTDAREKQTDENDTTGKAAIYAACDLDLLGTGALVVRAGYNNGIQTKDDLEIKNLMLKVTAPNNAVKGNDSLTIKSGEITAISTGGDALKTDNSDVSSKGNQRGTVTISGGNVTLYAANDGIDAAYDTVISGTPNVTVFTYTYSAYTEKNGLTSDSYKGIKADNAVSISGGVLVINAVDDGIHANNDVALENGAAPLGNITITGGSITVVSGDDGIHADNTLQIDDGFISIVNAYEGLEGYFVLVNGGETHVYATDDGVNATGANERATDGQIVVTGGKLYVEVQGRDVDGIDSNGSYRQTGGFVVVSNPNADQSGNMAAVDASSTVTVTGGVLIALGTVPSGGGMGGPGGPGGRGGHMGMGGMNAASVPTGAVTFSGTLAAGSHTFTYGEISETFTLRNRVSAGFIWADGISASNYTLQ